MLKTKAKWPAFHTSEPTQESSSHHRQDQRIEGGKEGTQIWTDLDSGTETGYDNRGDKSVAN